MSDANHVSGRRPHLDEINHHSFKTSECQAGFSESEKRDPTSDIQSIEEPQLRRSQRKRVLTEKVSEYVQSSGSNLTLGQKQRGVGLRSETKSKNGRKKRNKQSRETFFDRHKLYVAPELRSRADMLPPAHFLPEETLLKLEKKVEEVEEQPIDAYRSEQEDAFNCYCGQPDNNKMIQCDECQTWLHFKCEKLSEHDVKKIAPSQHFYCHFCRAKNRKKQKLTKSKPSQFSSFGYYSESSVRTVPKTKLPASTFSGFSSQDPLDLLLKEIEKRDEQEIQKSSSITESTPSRNKRNLKFQEQSSRDGSVSHEEQGSPKIVQVRPVGQIASKGRLEKIRQLNHRSYSLVVDTGEKSPLQVGIDEGDRSILNNIGGYEVFDEFKQIQQVFLSNCVVHPQCTLIPSW